ncbi:MAG: glycosyltransferase, partial [Blastochloris sp.]|nr:glycosyltransferase [Blastochloris sp.]
MTSTPSYKIQFWAPNFSLQDGGIQQFSRLLHQALKKSPFVSSLYLVPLRPGFFGKILFLLHALLFLLAQRPDFILITHLHLARLYPLLRFLKIPYAVFCHGIECWNLSSTRDRHALTHAAHILAVSRYTLARIRSQLPACNAQFSLFPDHIEAPPAPLSSKKDA